MKQIINIARSIIYFLSGLAVRNTNIQVFGAWLGERVSDNSMYYLKYLISLNENEFKKFVWIGKLKVKDDVKKQFGDRVTFEQIGSMRSYYYLLRTKYIYVTHGFWDFGKVNLTKGAYVVQFWHGFPIKKIVEDINSKKNIEGQQYFEHYSMFLASSNIMEYRMKSAFKSFGIANERVIREGEPRNQILVTDGFSSKKEKILHELNINPSKKIVAYLPTFRDSTKRIFSFLNIDKHLKKILHDNNIVILEKQHFVNRVKNNEERDGLNVVESIDEHIDTQDILLIADVLITDFSSVFADYLLLDRPIIHFLFDGDSYVKNDREIYSSKINQEFAGVTCSEVNELVENIIIAVNNDHFYEEQRRKINKLMNEYSTEKICENINYQIKKIANDVKP